ncbi:hypothetical protein ABB37_00100 [Leptomonas pyrrhocoris]|uniref:UDP-galactose transporter n=1 Tax=Leptomonas pyrrhocoris TaxID=157538 RepID=A0A0M9GA25_LEPPY|nr:hypothetical protein ABB37_00100 [Leptomonas pyrrhocoris]KPA85736.1 hypothetical protein ABB37_00100 [Leptomonas pyrrhocoris]|eukprot:XP_015664175.1 hypothetical protein ABB37_00100 [Leptomonas pyrrhocoris]
MFFCLVGINLCFGWWSLKQERVIKKPYLILEENAASNDVVLPAHKRVFLSTVYGMTLTQTLAGFLMSATLLGFHNVVCRCAKRPGTSSAVTTRTTSVRSDLQGQTKLTLRDVPELLAMGYSNIFGSSLGYAAMRRLSFPVTLTAKMAKMLPVMLVGSVWYHTRYPARKVIACFCITGGVITFALLDRSSSPGGKPAKATDPPATSSLSVLGVALMIVNLLMDGYTNSTQDVLVRRHRWSGASLMMRTNFVSVICVLSVLAVLEWGEQPWAWLCSFVDLVLSSVARSPDQVGVRAASASLSFLPFHDLSNFVGFLARCDEARNDVLLMSVLSAAGQLFIFHTISVFGTLTVTAMTLLRKVGSVLLSIYVHGHQVRSSQWAALATVFIGIVSEGYINIQEASRRQRHSPASSPPAAGTNSVLHNSSPTLMSEKTLFPTNSLPPTSSSSSIAMMTDSRSTTPANAIVEHYNE